MPYETAGPFALAPEESGYTGDEDPRLASAPHRRCATRSARFAPPSVRHSKSCWTAPPCVPAGSGTTPPRSSVARGLEKHNALLARRALRRHGPPGPARLAAEVDILITGGELGRTLYEFAAFLHNKTYDVVQPDTRICGGIWAAKKISTLAASFGVPCIQHGTGGFALAGYIQAGCCDDQLRMAGDDRRPAQPAHRRMGARPRAAEEQTSLANRERLRLLAGRARTRPRSRRGRSEGVPDPCLDRRSLHSGDGRSAARRRPRQNHRHRYLSASASRSRSRKPNRPHERIQRRRGLHRRRSNGYSFAGPPVTQLPSRPRPPGRQRSVRRRAAPRQRPRKMGRSRTRAVGRDRPSSRSSRSTAFSVARAIA